MNKKNWKLRFVIYLVIASWLLIIANANAFYGARPMGMGGAFTALADDGNAPYWNPAGMAVNPGVNLSGTTLLDQRNRSVGDNVVSLKMCYETQMGSPFEWIAGVGMLSGFAMSGAKLLYDQGVIKKGWGNDIEKTKRDESTTEQKKEEKTASIKEGAKKAAPWYYPRYRRPTYWEDRYSNSGDAEYSPLNKAQFALGLTWMYDTNATQKTNWYTITLATGYEEKAVLGANINIYDILTNTTSAHGLGAGLDIGALLRPVEQIALGLNIKEILTTQIQWTDNTVSQYAMEVNAGFAFKPLDELTLAVDAHNYFQQGGSPRTFHYGVEVKPTPGIALRCGLHDTSKTAGISIGVSDFILDYAYLGGDFARTQMVGLTWMF